MSSPYPLPAAAYVPTPVVPFTAVVRIPPHHDGRVRSAIAQAVDDPTAPCNGLDAALGDLARFLEARGIEARALAEVLDDAFASVAALADDERRAARLALLRRRADALIVRNARDAVAA